MGGPWGEGAEKMVLFALSEWVPRAQPPSGAAVPRVDLTLQQALIRDSRSGMWVPPPFLEGPGATDPGPEIPSARGPSHSTSRTWSRKWVKSGRWA